MQRVSCDTNVLLEWVALWTPAVSRPRALGLWEPVDMFYEYLPSTCALLFVFLSFVFIKNSDLELFSDAFIKL